MQLTSFLQLFQALSKQHNRSTSPMCPDMSLPTSSNQHLPHNPPMKSNLSKKESTSTSPPEVRKLTQAKGCPNDKESMKEFVEMFKQRRDELGFSQVKMNFDSAFKLQSYTSRWFLPALFHLPLATNVTPTLSNQGYLGALLF